MAVRLDLDTEHSHAPKRSNGIAEAASIKDAANVSANAELKKLKVDNDKLTKTIRLLEKDLER